MYPQWINDAIKLRENGLSYAKIAKEVKSSKQTVSYYLKQKGYGPNEKYIRLNQKQPNKKHINENYFEIIDNEHKAYWLGFLYADGCVNETRSRIELSLKEEDYYHLQKFKEDLESEHKIGLKTKTIGDKTYKSYRLSINRKKMKEDLINLGCIPNKTLKLKFPTERQVPKHLINHFIRGYIDGDGCITNSTYSIMSLEILGTEEFLNGIRKHFDLPNDKYLYDFNHSQIKRLMLTGKNAYNILNKIYENSDIFLIRKFNKYKEFAPLFSNK